MKCSIGVRITLKVLMTPSNSLFYREKQQILLWEVGGGLISSVSPAFFCSYSKFKRRCNEKPCHNWLKWSFSLQSYRGSTLLLPDWDTLHVPLHHHVHHHPACAWKTHGLRSKGTSPNTVHLRVPPHTSSLVNVFLFVLFVQLYNDSEGKIWRILELISGGGNTDTGGILTCFNIQPVLIYVSFYFILYLKMV